MCGRSFHKALSPSFTLSDGLVFTLADGVVADDEMAPSRKAMGGLSVLLEARRGRAVVSLAPRLNARRKALELAERTGNPVTVAEILDAGSGILTATLRRVGYVWTAKADPLSTESFDDWEEELTEELEAIAIAAVPSMVEGVEDLFEADFAAEGAAGVEALREGLALRLSIPPETVAEAQQVVMSERLAVVVERVGGAMVREPAIQGTLGATLSLPGRELGDLMSRFNSFFIRDQFGNASRSLGQRAAEIVNRGLAEGLGRVEMARELRATVSGALEMKGYWETVSSNAIAHARSYTQGASMRAAGIEAYRIIAVLDDVTTDWCLYLNDKVVPIAGAMDLMDRQLAAATPEEFMDSHPLAMQQGDRIFHRLSDGTERDLLRVVERGEYGKPGVYIPAFPASQLLDASVGLPPYHHRCRTTFIAV